MSWPIIHIEGSCSQKDMVRSWSYLLFPQTWFSSTNYSDLTETKKSIKKQMGRIEKNRKELWSKTWSILTRRSNLCSASDHTFLSNGIDWQIAYLAKIAVVRIHMCGIMIYKQDFKTVLVVVQGQKPFHVLWYSTKQSSQTARSSVSAFKEWSTTHSVQCWCPCGLDKAKLGEKWDPTYNFCRLLFDSQLRVKCHDHILW